MPVRVLIADDQALVRAGLRMTLQAAADITVIGEVADGEQAVAFAARDQPDVVLMDVRMPGLDGIEATRQIVCATHARVLILTTFDLDDYAFDGLRAGASGFLLKDVEPSVLYVAVRAVAHGDAVLTPRITRDLVDRFARNGCVQRVIPAGRDPLDTLTERERQTFDLIASGLSNAEIAERMFLAEATVKTHVTRLLAKLRLRDRVQVVIYAYERQLR